MKSSRRRAPSRVELARIAEETGSYYESLTCAERAEDGNIAAASAEAAAELDIDGPPLSTARRARKRRRR